MFHKSLATAASEMNGELNEAMTADSIAEPKEAHAFSIVAIASLHSLADNEESPANMARAPRSFRERVSPSCVHSEIILKSKDRVPEQK